ncbi:unnamed protein product [Orchesella dallaii]|uniref:Lipocalin/cytosolic fatty-acid binding domain-containing protein n=1 Tax=Orchesella dallaii TaxID=48710 RepID=A0ABP1QT15_9HEXA
MWPSAIVALFCMASAIQGLELNSTKGQPCFNISMPKTPILDENWALSVGPFYYPIVSTIDLYLASVDLLQKDPKDVSIATIYYDSCLTWYINSNGTISLKGFNELTREYKQNSLGDNPDEYTFVAVGGNQNLYAGTAYTTLTDNKTFFFTATCFKNGQMAFGVGSTTPSLPEKTRKMILDHAVSLGFNVEDITGLKYETCKS